MPSTTSPAASVINIRAPHTVPATTAATPIVFWAASFGPGKSFVGNAPFHTADDRVSRDMAWCKEWLYFPDAFSRALKVAGIHNQIQCHSGRTVVDGEYTD